MDRLLNETIEYIENEKLLQSRDKVLVAVSGGVDSMALVYLLNELKYQLGMVHANFQLRGAESDLDEKLVVETATRLKIPIFTKKFSTKEYSAQKGISIQMAAREIRYQWFEEIRKEQGYQKIATAHHINDALETIILNIAKGTGIAGLHGILPKRGRVVRPLLFASKEQIISYVTARGLNWREDQSNQDDHYQRNLIRNQVLPWLKKINPKIENTTRDTIEIIRSVEQQYQKTVVQLRQQLLQYRGKHVEISKSGITGMTPALLVDVLEDFGFNLDQCRNLLQQGLKQSGKVFSSASHALNIDRDSLIISPLTGREEKEASIEQDQLGLIEIGNQRWNISVHPGEGYEVKSKKWLGAFDFDKLCFPLKIRNWAAGDRFYPLGMGHQKKISDFLIDHKVPLNFKGEIQLLESEEEVAWVIGYRIDDRFKVTGETRKVLEISVEFPTSNTE